ncbi:MAG TPA: N-acetylgalactosamine 6-sulfate sulfatase, partial [Pirellulales bacterium]|nr:N-acetylgalactosamine 6-sulfate sulfatase [Pirellulales bacterium]
SLVPLLRQSGGIDRKSLFNFFPHTAGNKPAGVTVRSGDWKLIRWFNATNQYPDRYELYNLGDDLSETNNLATKMPEKVQELDSQIDSFLKETAALVPKPNPNYKPSASKAKRSADPLQGWVPKQCTAVVADGVLRVSSAGRAPFLAYTQIKHAGPAVLKLRVRSSSGGTGKVQWRTAEQETFPAIGQTVSFDLPASDAFQDVSVELPVQGELVHFRLYLPVEKTPLEIAEAQFVAAGSAKPVRAWSFNAAK